MFPHIDAVIWDVDDTLVATALARRALQRKLLSSLGVSPAQMRAAIRAWERMFWYFDTTDFLTVLPVVIAEADPTATVETKRLNAALHSLDIRGEILAALHPCKGAYTILQACVEAGIRMGIVSNGEREFQQGKLRACGLDQFFPSREAIIICNADRCKPYPDGLLACCAALRVNPLSSLYVGDRAIDMVTSALAGCLSVRIKTVTPDAREPSSKGRLGVEREFLAVRDLNELGGRLFG